VAGHCAERPHGSETSHPCAARQAHQQGFSLILPMMTGQDRGDPALPSPSAKGTISRCAGFFLKLGNRFITPIGFQDGVPDAGRSAH
jgi:hypothetical protein